jgi:hypothetical protein
LSILKQEATPLSWGRRALCDLWQILASPNLYKKKLHSSAIMHCPCKLPLPCCRRRCPPLTRLRPPPGSSWPSRWSPKSLASCYQLTLLKKAKLHSF